MSNKFYEHERYVTIYHYDKWDKYFIEKEDNHYQQIGIGLPAHSTDIPVPEKVLPEGHVYVFDHDKWIVKKDNFVRINLVEVNYCYKDKLPLNFKIESFPYHEMPKYEEIERFTNPQLQSLMLFSKYELIQHEFININKFHDENIRNIQNSNQMFSIGTNTAAIYRLKTEGLILAIRSLLDELVQLTYVTCYKSIFVSDYKIKVDCLGSLFNSKNDRNYPLCKQIIIGDGINYEDDNSGFLKTINDLFNSIKHSFLHYEAYALYATTPNVVSFYQKQNDFSSNKVLYLNHSLLHLQCGFKSNFKRIIENQKKYLLTKE